jgi:hypothetical protein
MEFLKEKKIVRIDKRNPLLSEHPILLETMMVRR